MNMLKRMASVAVLAIMMLQIAVFAAPVPADVIGTEYESAASLLCALDIMVGDGDNFNPDDNITRAEFAQILMKTLALDEAAEAYSPVGLFTDVPTSEWYAAPVELGAGIGAIKGYGDGTFGPDDNVLGIEAIKMMTFACGHDITAEENGGYPSGYLATAQQIGMLRGLSGIDYNVPMTRGQAAILCANTLKVDMMKKVSDGDRIIYTQTKDVNLLSEKHNVYKVDGIVTANDVTSLWESSVLRSGTVQIEYGNTSGIFEVGETTIADALGQYIRAYYRYDEDLDQSTIISYEVLSNRTTIEEVSLSDIDYNSITNTRVEYWEDKENDTRTTDIDIVSTPSLIFNGASRTVNTSIVETFNQINNEGLTGTARFIDYDGNGVMDVVNIMAYETIVVSRTDTKNYIITKEADTYVNGNNKVTVDVESSNVTAEIVDIDGDELEFSDIAEGDILTLAKSDEGNTREYVYIQVCDDSIDGEITEIGTDDDKYVLTIDGERYEVTDGYMNYVTNGLGMGAESNQIKIKVGSSGEFFLNAFGEIAYDQLSGTSASATFGFLKTYAVGKGTDDSLQFRIYSDGAYADYKAASRVEVDGVLTRSTADLIARLESSINEVASNYYAGEMMTAMLFETDSEGDIRMIDTPYKAPEESQYSLQPVRGGSLAFQSLKYNSTTKRLGSLMGLESSAVVIQLPEGVDDLNTASKLSMVNTGSWANEQSVNIQGLTTDPDSYNLQFGIVKSSEAGRNLGDTPSQQHDKQMLVVSSVDQVMDSEGNPTIRVRGLQEGNEVEVMVDSEYYENDLYTDIWSFDASSSDANKKLFAAYADQVTQSPDRQSQILLPGDAIRFNTNSEGEMIFAKPVYLIDAKVFKADDQGNTQGATRYRALDLALVNRIEDDNAFFKYIIDKKTSNTNSATAILTVDENGYVTGSSSSNGENYTFFQDGHYIFGDTGMRDDEINTPSQFKIMVYDANEAPGRQVYAGTESDLYDATSDETPASLVIMQFRSGNPRGMYIIKY